MADPDPVIAEAVAKVRRTAYEAGWRDAIYAITKVVNQIPDPAAVAIILPTVENP